MKGICRLTGEQGKLVKSHVIPRALTRIEPVAAPIVQIIGEKAKPSRRWDSWYDKTIVTRAGEDIRKNAATAAMRTAWLFDRFAPNPEPGHSCGTIGYRSRMSASGTPRN